MNAVQLIRDFPNFFKQTIDVKPYWGRVNGQAIEHTRRNETSVLLAKRRPNESDSAYNYRLSVKRWITKEGPDKFISKASRIFLNSGISMDKNIISETLTENLNSNPYNYLGQRTDVSTFFYKCVLPNAIDDPNAILVDFPYLKEEPNTIPADPEAAVLNPFPISIKSIIVPSSDLVYMPSEEYEVFAWLGGLIDVNVSQTASKRIVKKEFYWIADEEFYYKYVPTGRKDRITNQEVYELIEWYKHNCGFLPLNVLPGNLASTKEDPNVKYHESFLQAFFEYADEFVGRFSDGQMVATRFAYPKMVAKPMQCPTCKGDGALVTKDQEGKPKRNKCVTCNGKGQTLDIDPLGTLIVPDKSGNIEKGTNQKPLEYITPDTGILDHAYEKPFDILLRGFMSIGLDLVGNQTESGVAKEKRMEIFKDVIENVASGIFNVKRRHLKIKECLLVRDENERLEPSIVLPESYEVRDAGTLQEEAKNAIPADRMLAQLKHIEKKYQGDNRTQWVYKMAYWYSPLLAMTDDEITLRLARDIYTDQDVLKKDYAIQTFIKIADEVEDYAALSEQEAFELADEYLIRIGVTNQSIEVFDGGEIVEEKPKNKLLETVGGITNLVQINQAIANGEMTEEAGINAIMLFFDVSREIASGLLSVPNAPPT